MTIAEVSKKYGLSADTLRYYERVGLIPRVTRKANGIRDYAEEDCKRVEFVKCMRGAGLPIEVLIEYFALYEQGDITVGARRDLLIEQRNQLINRMDGMNETLERLNLKIESCDNIVQNKQLLNS